MGQHQMAFQHITSQGFYVFRCPTCGRKIGIQFPDEQRGISYKKRIWVQGDEHAAHTGGVSELDVAIEMDEGMIPDPWPEQGPEQARADDAPAPDVEVPEAFRRIRLDDTP